MIQNAFPNQIFPTNAIHEFISNNPEDSAATNGFITGLYSQLINQGQEATKKDGYPFNPGNKKTQTRTVVQAEIFPDARNFK